MNLAIVDYGMGNIHSLKSAILKIDPNIEMTLTNDCGVLAKSKAILLPGVGHFGAATVRLRDYGLINCLRQLVLEKHIPILGICLGMQLLFNESEESPGDEGLALIPGNVTKMVSGKHKVPHIGFNSVDPNSQGKMYHDVPTSDFYFVHSFSVSEVQNEEVLCSPCSYNASFVASVEYNHIWGTQFHPEKSQKSGLKIIENFITEYVN